MLDRSRKNYRVKRERDRRASRTFWNTAKASGSGARSMNGWLWEFSDRPRNEDYRLSIRSHRFGDRRKTSKDLAFLSITSPLLNFRSINSDR